MTDNIGAKSKAVSPVRDPITEKWLAKATAYLQANPKFLKEMQETLIALGSGRTSITTKRPTITPSDLENYRVRSHSWIKMVRLEIGGNGRKKSPGRKVVEAFMENELKRYFNCVYGLVDLRKVGPAAYRTLSKIEQAEIRMKPLLAELGLRQPPRRPHYGEDN